MRPTPFRVTGATCKSPLVRFQIGPATDDPDAGRETTVFITVEGQVPKQGVKTAVILATDDPHYPKIPIPIWISNMHSSSIQRTLGDSRRHFSSRVLTACGKMPRSIRTGSPSVSSSLGRNSFSAVSKRSKSARVRRGYGARFICTPRIARHRCRQQLPRPDGTELRSTRSLWVCWSARSTSSTAGSHAARTNWPPVCRHNCCTVSSFGNCRTLSRLTFP